MFEPFVIIVWVLVTLSVLGPIVWLLKRGYINNLQANAALLLLSLAYYTASEQLLSQPKPFEWVLFPADKYEVVAAQITPGERVYLWLLPEGGDHPEYYTLSWAQAEKRGLGTDLLERMSEGRRQGGRKVFYSPLEHTETPGLYLEDLPQHDPEDKAERGVY